MKTSESNDRKSSEGTFPAASAHQTGYLPSEVDSFLALARETYENRAPAGSELTAKQIRSFGFPLHKHGYSARHVDSALDRLEEVFFDRERRAFIALHGEDAWWASVQQSLSEVRGRLGRPRGKRFSRKSILTQGYRRADVDTVLDRITRMLSGEETLTINDIRNVVFRDELSGYDEDQVDALLDAVIELILATG